MQQIIKIGLTYTGNEVKHGYYAEWLKANDAIQIIKLCESDNNLYQVKDLDGIVISGGVDVHPINYNSNTVSYSNAPEKFNQQRDAFEIAVFNEAIKLNIPLLGICRGMQLINCILGGDLVQDMGLTANVIHKSEGIDKIHSVNILPNTLMSKITLTEIAEVNSAHHQCIHNIGDGLIANVIAADGCIEGIEWKVQTGKSFFLGVQWHPERMFKLEMGELPLSKNIRAYFVKEVKRIKI
ncbi:MAG: gamma-glutamyl-gamma-aminobutyrate hydrolase family protein [Ferruginibacter sp.]